MSNNEISEEIFKKSLNLIQLIKKKVGASAEIYKKFIKQLF